MQNKKILFISTNIYPIVGGDTIYTAGLIYRLSQKNNLRVLTLGRNKNFVNHPIYKNVEIISFSKLTGLFYKIIKLLFNNSLLQEYSFGIKNFLKNEKLNIYDYIILDHLRCYSISKNIFKIDRTKTKIIYVAHNVESINQAEKLQALSKKKFLSKLSNNVHSIEQKMINSCDSIWTLNKDDLRIITKSHHINNKVIKPYFPWKRIKFNNKKNCVTKEILILGSLNWYPNIKGVLHFVNDIFPLILNKNNSIVLNIVGQNPSSEIMDLANDRINIYSNVESVDPYILRSDLLIIPNRSGTGSKIKVLESIMKGLPLVMYKENITGYENLNLSSPFVVEDIKQFSESIILLLNNPRFGIDFIKKNLKLINNNSKI
ncbi:MAG: glycosyltransferase [Rickettsiales bacterium TMED289]|nr:MAG: glycosyltransferase [Rickettsiales bacterium TMED289]|tara:strand:- start:2231 stop:3352 length:1122 start_codon:yes stop_codon:yes gene_type:complete